MRRAILCAVLFLFALRSFAAKSVTADQLEQQLTSLHAKSDSDAARQIADLKLTERLSYTRETALEKALPGEKSRQALAALADQSQFLPPPANEIPQQPAPDVATQRAIMGRVIAYISKTIPQLPNFLATRQTTHFEDSPQRKADYVNKYEPLRPVGSAAEDVSYADGREVVESPGKSSVNPHAARGLSTWGEFGPILSTVLLDAARNKLGWLRWEQGSAGPLAVFAYSVPREGSHYEVDYCCVQDSEGRTHTFHELEGYEGEMAVDPATGAIMRLMLKAQIKSGAPVSLADLLVEYGPVEIGGKSYICPLRSVALSRARSLGQEQVEMVDQGPHGAAGPGLAMPLVTGSTADVTEQTLLNDAAFTGYHVFRTETRVVTSADAGLPALGAQPVETPASATTSTPPPPSATPAPAPASEPAESASAVPAPPAAPVDSKPLPEAAANAEPEMSSTDVTGAPDVPAAQNSQSPHTGFTLRTTSRLVDVPVAAFDKKGNPITDLKPDELEIYDNGRKQNVNSFGQAGAGTLTAPAAKPIESGAPATDEEVTNRPPARPTISMAAAPSAARETHTTVLLIDSGNVAFSDLTNARREILRFLKTVPADERVGLYVLHKFGFQILLEPTIDHVRVATKLASWMPSAQDLLYAQHEEDKNRQNMEYVQHITDLLYVNGNTPSGNGDAYMPVDPQLRTLGDAPELGALVGLQGVGRHLGAIAGHKTLVWAASDNVLADFSEKAPGNEKGDKGLDPLILRARETLNEAHVSLYPLDVSQLEAGGVRAEQHSASVELKPTTNPTVDMLTLPQGSDIRQEALEAYNKSQRNMYPGRITAQLQQDTHPIQEIFVQLALATGGRALRRAGDIAAELSSIVADGRAAYLLSFTPDTPADGKYHTLTVKCLRKDVTLRYRNGYLYSEEPATMKDRFREAVWQPRDENEIGLTAVLAKEADKSAVRLNIAATDLEMAQQNGRWTDKVDVFLVVRDDSGLHAIVAGKRLGLALTPATYQRDMKDGLELEEALPKMPDGALVRLIVIDENSRRMGSVTLGTKVN